MHVFFYINIYRNYEYDSTLRFLAMIHQSQQYHKHYLESIMLSHTSSLLNVPNSLRFHLLVNHQRNFPERCRRVEYRKSRV